MSVQLHSSQEECDVALSNPQTVGIEAAATNKLRGRRQLELTPFKNLRQRADHKLQVLWRQHWGARQGAHFPDHGKRRLGSNGTYFVNIR